MNAVDRSGIAQLIPHQGAMLLLDRVTRWDPSGIVAMATSHRAADHPLRSHGRLRAVHLCEYGAQAAAVHGGLVARAAGTAAAPGYLVSIRDVAFTCQRIDDLDNELQIRAELLLQDSGSWQYLFAAYHAGIELATGRLAIIRRRQDEN
jgi:predicted hotdog family 3-hydroxylacyl-ACP dehydratase